MTVCVGLVTYNSIADLPRCIAGLRAQTRQPLRIMALDNASSDGCADWLRANAPEIQLSISAENIGYGRAHNRIIEQSNLQADDYYMALNPDAELAPNYIAALIDVLEASAEIGWATGKLLMKDAAGAPTGQLYSAGHGLLRSGFAFNIGYELPDSADFAEPREVFGAPGAAVIYKSRLIHEISEAGQFFDPAMFMYGEDTDVDWRARRQGWRCWYVAQAAAYHRGSHPSGTLKMIAVANRYRSVLKNAALIDLVTYNIPYLILHCLVRLIVTPRLGARLMATLLRGLPTLRRSPAKIDPRELRAWFRWSAQQPTNQRSRLAQWL